MRFSAFASKKESGYSLVIVLMISVILVTLLAAVSTLVMSEAKSADRQAKQKQAYYLAEEGVERFAGSLYDTVKHSASPTNQSSLDAWVAGLGLPWNEANPAGTIEIQALYKNNGLIEVKSTGKLNGTNIQQEIHATIQLFALPKVFTYALGLAKKYEITGNPRMTLNGNLYINGEADFKSGLQINDGVIELGPDAKVKQSDLKNFTVNHIEAIKIPSYQELSNTLQGQALQPISTEEVRLSDLVGAANQTGHHIMFLDRENVKLILDMNTDLSQSLLIVAKGNVALVSTGKSDDFQKDGDFRQDRRKGSDKQKQNQSGQADSFAMFLYAPSGNIEFETHDVQVTGGIFAGKSVEIKGRQGNSNILIQSDNQLFSSQGIGDIPGFTSLGPTIINRRTR